MPDRPVRVLVFSTAVLFREGLCSLIEHSDTVDHVTGAGDWSSVLTYLDRGEVDTVIIDRDSKDSDTVVDDLFEIAPNIRIVLLSSQDNRLAVFMQSPVDESYRLQLLAAVAQASPIA